jgi:hypothetical protein
MREGPEDIVRAVARGYAVMAFLCGAALLVSIVFLVMAFGPRGFFDDWLFIAMILPGIATAALAPFIWREKAWAMLTVLVIAVGYRFFVGTITEDPYAQWTFTGLAALFALFTGVRLWLGPDPARHDRRSRWSGA